LPSDDDRNKINQEVQGLYTEFVATGNAPAFVNSTSDERYDSTWIKKGSLPYQIDSLMFNSAPGTTFGPYIENNMFQMARLVDVQTRPDSLKASHILISYQGTNVNPDTKLTKEQAKAKADSVLKLVKTNGAKFDELAGTISDDQTAAKTKGDLNWFADGAMVPAFNNAVLNGKIGDVIQVETQFGFHIIKVTESLNKNVYEIANIQRTITPSENTRNKAFRKADFFASSSSDYY
jgi:peptidyl-prolyl cis-trans isomerase D